MPINSVLHTGAQSIDRVLNAGAPVLLMFWRRSGAQSTTLDPLLDNLARSHAGRLLVAKVDADAEPALVSQYNVNQFPTLLVTRDAQVVGRIVGQTTAASIQPWIDYLLHGGAKPTTTPAPERTPHGNARTKPTAGTSARGHAMGVPVVLTDATFQQEIAGAKVALVDFWAEWCGPCRMVAPSVDQLARDFAGRVLVAKVNVDQNPRTAQTFNIMSIPALLIFHNGRVVDQIVGAQPLPVLRSRLERVLNTAGARSG